MTKERQGEIALAILEAHIEENGGLRVGAKMRRELGNMAEKTGIPAAELAVFSRKMLMRQIAKAYGVTSVTLELSGTANSS